MQLVTDDGVKLHVQELGQGPPVIMLHGLLVGNMSTWYFTAAPELARTHRVILFDLRGHGLSARATSGYDVESLTSDLESIVGRLTDEPVSLVGHSYGALVALTFALRRPKRVRKLAVVEAPLPPSSLTELDRFLGSTPSEMLEALPDVIKTALLESRRKRARLADTLRFLAEESSLIDDVRRAKDLPDQALAAIGCPLLAVYGTASSCRAAGVRLARVVPDARLVELEGGHFLPLEHPRALSGWLRRFIDG
jgi:pimeloyl-ACP methyl ester carboxylesterase